MSLSLLNIDWYLKSLEQITDLGLHVCYHTFPFRTFQAIPPQLFLSPRSKGNTETPSHIIYHF